MLLEHRILVGDLDSFEYFSYMKLYIVSLFQCLFVENSC